MNVTRESQPLASRLKTRVGTWARALKRDVHVLYLAAGDPRVPWYAKALAVAVAGYALSPIDLIPDFIPVLGYLDDLIIVPLGIWLAVRLIPHEVIEEYRRRAVVDLSSVGRIAAGAVIAIWIFGTLVIAMMLCGVFWRCLSRAVGMVATVASVCN